jgi:hypothetical protein
MKILAFDPGKKNFAYALIEDERCRDHGMLPTVSTLNSVRYGDELRAFVRAIDQQLARLTDRDFVWLERMQHRPMMGGGAVVEIINVMIGALLTRAVERGIRAYPVAATTWKSHMMRRHGIEKKMFTMTTQKLRIKQPPGSPTKTKAVLVPGLLDGQPGAAELTAHEGDAIGIGCYGWWSATAVDIVRRVL